MSTPEPKNFDAARTTPRGTTVPFIIAGATLHARAAIRPEALHGWWGLSPDATREERTAILDSTIREFLPEKDRTKWDELRGREDGPITLDEMYGLIVWLTEINADRPTTAPSSSPGSEPVGATSSEDDSSSPEETPS